MITTNTLMGSSFPLPLVFLCALAQSMPVYLIPRLLICMYCRFLFVSLSFVSLSFVILCAQAMSMPVYLITRLVMCMYGEFLFVSLSFISISACFGSSFISLGFVILCAQAWSMPVNIIPRLILMCMFCGDPFVSLSCLNMQVIASEVSEFLQTGIELLIH